MLQGGYNVSAKSGDVARVQEDEAGREELQWLPWLVHMVACILEDVMAEIWKRAGHESGAWSYDCRPRNCAHIVGGK